MSQHAHCQTCVSLTCVSDGECPFLCCPSCDIKLHECKLAEHLSFTCPEAFVKCLNAIYGCDKELRLNQLGVHLEHCPASVVRCPFVYQRWQMEHYNPPLPSFKLPDEKFLQNDKDFVTYCNGTKLSLDKMSAQCIVDHEYYLEAREDNGQFFPGKLHKRISLLSNIYTYHTHRVDGVIPCDLFICGEYVRRDQFQSHMINHLELMVDLPLRISRCPLYCFGCDYGTSSYSPTLLGSQLDFSHSMSSFVINYSRTTTSDCLTLTNLPVEVLLYIFSFLDSLSFWSLSQVSRYFRDLCEDFLTSKGIVYSRWERKCEEKVTYDEEGTELTTKSVKWFREDYKVISKKIVYIVLGKL